MVDKKDIYLILDKQELVEEFEGDLKVRRVTEENIQGIVKDVISKAYEEKNDVFWSNYYRGFLVVVDKTLHKVTVYILKESREYTFHTF